MTGVQTCALPISSGISPGLATQAVNAALPILPLYGQGVRAIIIASKIREVKREKKKQKEKPVVKKEVKPVVKQKVTGSPKTKLIIGGNPNEDEEFYNDK